MNELEKLPEAAPSTETLEAIHRAWMTRNVALKAYREAVGVGVIGDSAVALVALMATNRPEYKALEKARDELRSLATAHAGDLVEEIWRLRAAVNALPELLAERDRLTARVKLLEASLRPFAQFADHVKNGGIRLANSQDGWCLTVPVVGAAFLSVTSLSEQNFTRARAALQENKP